MDVVMPGAMTGRNFAIEPRKVRSTLNVLFTSGCAETALRRAGQVFLALLELFETIPGEQGIEDRVLDVPVAQILDGRGCPGGCWRA
jgi:hypothetical protein